MRLLAAALVLLCLLAVPALSAATGAVAADPPRADAVDDPMDSTDWSPQSSIVGAHVSTVFASNTEQTAEPDHSFTQTIEIRLRQNGDARVTVTQSIPIDDDRDAFEQLAEEFEQGQHDVGAETIQSLVDDVAEETGREMTVTNEQRTSNVANDTGTLSHSFTWTSFAEVENGRLLVGDAFHLRGQNWLGTFDDHQRLVIHAPPDHTVQSATQPLNEGRLVWEGPRTFDVGDVQASYQYQEPVIDEQLITMLLGGGGLIVAAVFLLIAWTYAGRPRRQSALRDVLPFGDDEPVEANAPPVEEANGGSIAASEIDPDLLSDEERIERLLERNGGRMKQANIVKETGWSNAKVSQLLSEMDEQDQVDKLRIGRENLITLPDEDVTDLE